MTQTASPTAPQLIAPAEAAQGVFAAWLNGTPAGTVPFLKPDHFSDPADAATWSAILEMEAQGIVGDHAGLRERLKRSAFFDAAELPVYFRSLLDSTERADAYSMKMHAGTVDDYARRRDMDAHGALERARARNLALPLPPDEELAVRKRYTVRTAADSLQPQPPLDWIVEPLIARGGLSIFYGEPGSKKTYSLLWLAVCVSTGKPWLDFSTKPCRTLIVDEESGEKRLSLRIAETLRGALADESTPLCSVSLAEFKLDDPDDIRDLTALIREQSAELVIIDSLAAVASGDENSKQDVQPLMSALRKTAETTNAAIVVIHHSGKNGIYRGSSALKASCDLMVHVRSADGSPFIEFKTEKNRDGVSSSWFARAVWVADGYQFYLEAAAAQKEKEETRLSRLQTYIVDYLGEHGPSSVNAIKAAATSEHGCTDRTAEKAVYTLTNLGEIRRVNAGGRGVTALYDLTDNDTAEDPEEDESSS